MRSSERWRASRTIGSHYVRSRRSDRKRFPRLRPPWLARSLLAAVIVVVAAACVVTPTHNGQAPLPIEPWTPNDPRRGIDLSPKTPLAPSDYAALELMRP